jgi:hypothetical protein
MCPPFVTQFALPLIRLRRPVREALVPGLLGLWLAVLCPVSLHADTNVYALSPGISTNLLGSTVQLSVLQNGLPLHSGFDFQWREGGTNLVDGGNISGSQTPVLTLTNLQLSDSGVYLATLSITGAVQAAAGAVVYVITQPAIQGVTAVNNGASLAFTVSATGGLLSFQWFWQGQPLNGATNSVLTFPNAYAQASAGHYSVMVTNPVGSAVSSGPGLLFTKPVPAGTYQGLFYDTNNFSADSAGFFQFTLSGSRRSFSGRITIGSTNYAFSGAFSSDHTALISVRRPRTTPLTLQLQLVTTNSRAPQVVGLLSDGVWTVPWRGNLLFFNAMNPSTLAGKYTLALLNTNNSPLVPNGHGCGTVVIRSTGAVVLSGRTADGMSIAQSCGLSGLGDWPLHVSMFRGRGRLLGWLTVQPRARGSIAGTNIFWLKGPGPEKLYPSGYSLVLQAAGSTYTPPSSNHNVFTFTSAVASFSGGDLFSGGAPAVDFVQVILRGPSTLIADPGVEALALAIAPANGIVTGRFVDFATGLRAPIRAVVLQQQNLAAGYFLSTNTAGSFTLSGQY